MKPIRSPRIATPPAAGTPIDRRGLVVGAGVAAGAALAAAVLHRRAVEPAPVAVAKPAGAADGYQETEHVLHYYRTARS